MKQITILMMIISTLTGCAAIRGAHGDAVAAQQTAAAQSTAGGVSPQTIVPPIQPRIPAQNATTNASKMIAPLH